MKKNVCMLLAVVFVFSLLLCGCETIDNAITKGFDAMDILSSGKYSDNNITYQNYRLTRGILDGNVELIKESVKSGATTENPNDGLSVMESVGSRTALEYALWIDDDRTKEIQALIDSGADINGKEEDFSYLIARTNDFDRDYFGYTRLLLDNGADPNIVTDRGYTSLDLMLKKGEWPDLHETDIIDDFLRHGAKVTPQTIGVAYENYEEINLLSLQTIVKMVKDEGKDTGLSPMVEAAILGDMETLKKEIWWGIPEKDQGIVTVFTVAFGSPDALKKVLHKVSVSKIVDEYRPLFWISSRYGNLDNVKYFVENEMVDSPHGLLNAVQYDYYDMAEYLIEKGIPIPSDISYGANFDALTWAARNGNINMAKLLLDAGALTDEKHIYSAMIGAISQNHTDMLKYLIEKNNVTVITQPNVNYLSNIIDEASFYGNTEAIEYLIQLGLDVNGAYDNGYPPIVSAYHYGGPDAVRVLLENGASVNNTDNEAHWLLFMIIVDGNFEMLNLFIDHGIDVNTKYDEMNALMIGAQQGSCNILKCLIEHGASINEIYTGETNLGGPILSPDVNGDTALHIAVRNGARECTQTLLEAGADYTIKNSQGKTAYDVAVDEHNEPIKEIFQDAGKIPDGSSSENPGILDKAIDFVKEQIDENT